MRAPRFRQRILELWMSHSGVWNHCGEGETSLSGSGREHRALLILNKEHLPDWEQRWYRRGLRNNDRQKTLKFWIKPWVWRENSEHLTCCRCRGKIEYSDIVSERARKKNNNKKKKQICLCFVYRWHLSWVMARRPGIQWEAILSYFISAAH